MNDRGRIIAAAHSIFLDYLFENSEDEHEKRQLGNNLFKWLTKSADLQDRDQIVDIDHIDAGLLCYSHYKLITWDYKIKVNNETIKRLKLYLNDGGKKCNKRKLTPRGYFFLIFGLVCWGKKSSKKI